MAALLGGFNLANGSRIGRSNLMALTQRVSRFSASVSAARLLVVIK